jgi:hypothetical protein
MSPLRHPPGILRLHGRDAWLLGLRPVGTDSAARIVKRNAPPVGLDPGTFGTQPALPLSHVRSGGGASSPKRAGREAALRLAARAVADHLRIDIARQMQPAAPRSASCVNVHGPADRPRVPSGCRRWGCSRAA